MALDVNIGMFFSNVVMYFIILATAATLFKAGKTKDRPFDAGPGVRVREFEVEELGDVRGKSLLHLQCHFGIDTLSWARLGAQVTGVDFSTEAIGLARELASETGIDARFVESSVQELRTTSFTRRAVRSGGSAISTRGRGRSRTS